MSVEFKVPGDFVVQQSPHNLPPVYRGEKMVVYGNMTPKRPPADNEITGETILRGKVLGKEVEHSVSFTFNPVSSSRVSLPTIHHLAAKALIKDWQDEEKSKEEIVKLSVESSVISSHTAFIAVDEENSEPVAGAMKTWDVLAGLDRSYSLCSSDNSSLSESDDDMGFGYFDAESIEESIEEEEEEQKVAMNFIRKKASNKRSFKSVLLAASAPSPQPAAVFMTPTPSSTLTAIITAQQADGSWKLDSTLTNFIAKSQKAIQDACPVKSDGLVAVVWATVLVLSLLKKKYSSQEEEWELIAMKAESWLKRQVLPSGVSIQDFYRAAKLLM